MLGVNGCSGQISCVLVLTSPKAARIVDRVTSRPWGISGGHALGPLASPNESSTTLQTSWQTRFKNPLSGDDLRRLLSPMAKNLADLTGARSKQSNGNGHGKAKGLRFSRFFTPPGSHAFDLVEWERRTAAITGEKGQVIFEQKDVEVPRTWSQLAINVVAQKYFRGSPGSPERETSVRQIIDRVVETLAKWGREGAYFATEEAAENWAEALRYLLVTQHPSLNSPV